MVATSRISSPECGGDAGYVVPVLLVLIVVALLSFVLVSAFDGSSFSAPREGQVASSTLALWRAENFGSPQGFETTTCSYDQSLWRIGYRFECTVWLHSGRHLAHLNDERIAVASATLTVQTPANGRNPHDVAVHFGDGRGSYLLTF